MAPNSWISLVLAPETKDALQCCITNIQNASPVPLDPMPYGDMHMTLVFLGLNLRGHLPARRTELDAMMETFADEAAAMDVETAFLEFDTLELFPPTKRNLLIAKYTIQGKALSAVRRLQKECFQAGLVSNEEHSKSQSTEFVAHITLGKFRGMKADQSTAVDKAISLVNSKLGKDARGSLSPRFEAACLCGGS